MDLNDVKVERGRQEYALGIERLRIGSQIALASLQGLLLLNGGAVVALFSLVAQGSGSAFVRHLYFPTIWWALASFAAGMISIIIAFVAGYLSQEIIARVELVDAANIFLSLSNEPLHGDVPHEWASRLLNIGIVAASMSAFAFIIGSGFGLWAALGAAK